MDGNEKNKFSWLITIIFIILAIILVIGISFDPAPPRGSLLDFDVTELTNAKGKTTTRLKKRVFNKVAAKKFCEARKLDFLLYENLSQPEICNVIREYANNPMRKKEDLCIIFIGSHGSNGTICDKYWRHLEIKEIIIIISLSMYLQKKDIFLFIQSCRGKFRPKTSPLKTAYLQKFISKHKKIKIPKKLDRLILMQSSQAGCKSKRGFCYPTVFQHLTDTSSDDMLSLLKKAANDVSNKIGKKDYRQIPDITYNKKQAFYLDPPQPFKDFISNLFSDMLAAFIEYDRNNQELELNLEKII